MAVKPNLDPGYVEVKTRAQVNGRVLYDELSGKVAFWSDKVACSEMRFC